MYLCPFVHGPRQGSAKSTLHRQSYPMVSSQLPRIVGDFLAPLTNPSFIRQTPKGGSAVLKSNWNPCALYLKLWLTKPLPILLCFSLLHLQSMAAYVIHWRRLSPHTLASTCGTTALPQAALRGPTSCGCTHL